MDATEFQKTYGGFWRFDPNKLNQTQADGVRFSTGHRHALALAWHPVSKQFFMVQMGRDNLNVVDPAHYDALDNAERVSEVMHLLREGVELRLAVLLLGSDQEGAHGGAGVRRRQRKRVDPDPYDKPVVAFPGHWAPLQMTIYTGTQFPEKYRGGAFVTFHGSWNRAPRAQAGYQVAFVPFDDKGMPAGTYETFADGFAGKARVREHGRRALPAGRAWPSAPTDRSTSPTREKGRIWRVIYTGETPTTARPSRRGRRAGPSPRRTTGSRGAQLYQQICAACHMPDGSGVAGHAAVARRRAPSSPAIRRR